MKAVVMTAPGGAEVLALVDVPAPHAEGDHDLRVRLKAAGVNPIDTKLRSRGTYFPDRLPTILGCDGAGIVEAIGRRVTRFKPGDAVYFCNGGITRLPRGGRPPPGADRRLGSPAQSRTAEARPPGLDPRRRGRCGPYRHPTGAAARGARVHHGFQPGQGRVRSHPRRRSRHPLYGN